MFFRWILGLVRCLHQAGSGLFRKAVLLEAGSAIIFFGALATHQELAGIGAQALGDLKSLGYQIPTDSEPVRVYPAATATAFTTAHAGGWRPGLISLRENPTGSLGPQVYLRHELMHEASYRTCAGRLPLWAEEAAAINFSGELKGQTQSGAPTGQEIAHLQEKVRIGAELDPASYTTLAKLLSLYGWPAEPCAVSREMEKALHADQTAAGFSYILISLLSGETLEAKGDLGARYPPGSLLKIPYAAALREAANQTIGEELSASNTIRLLERRKSFSAGTFRLLTSAVTDAPLTRGTQQQPPAEPDTNLWRQYLGERDQEGRFPFEANLHELALVMRASLLFRPERFTGLAENGFMPGSTLQGESEEYTGILRHLQAMSKTGTVSDTRGTPLVGHLMVAWPQDDPLFLAIFRSGGSNGAATIRRASEILKDWSTRYTPDNGQVRVRLLSRTPRDSWEIHDVCPTIEREGSGGWKERISTCGRFTIISAARGSRSERQVSGVLQSSADGNAVVLKTDPETYADATLSAEAQDLQGEAQKALRATIVWNGIHGSHRHPDTRSLCDSTHCMVFLGQIPDWSGRPGKTDIALLRLLNQIAAQKQLDWFPFSEGGIQRWETRMSSEDLQRLVNEPSVLDLKRERNRNGEVTVHLLYPEGEEKVSCEVFRAGLKLPSCPESIQYSSVDGKWIFQGVGKGHGLGLSVERARTLGRSGYDAAAILKDAFQ